VPEVARGGGEPGVLQRQSNIGGNIERTVTIQKSTWAEFREIARMLEQTDNGRERERT